MIVFGERDYGPARRWARTHVVTRFAHIWFVPLIPSVSYFVYPDADGDPACFAIRRDPRSILSGLVVGWLAPPCGLGAIFGAASLLDGNYLWSGGALAGIAVCVAGIALARRALAVEPLAVRRLRVLALDVLGTPIDPRWLLPGDAERERARWTAWLSEARRALGASYRAAPEDPFEVALEAEAPVGFVKVAAVVALLEQSLGRRRDGTSALVARALALDPQIELRAREEGLLAAAPVVDGAAPEVPLEVIAESRAAPPSAPDPSGVVSRMPEELDASVATRAVWTARAAGLAAAVAALLGRVFASDFVASLERPPLFPGVELEEELVKLGTEWLLGFGVFFALVGGPRQRLRWRGTPESLYLAALLGAALLAAFSACWRLSA